MESHRLLKKKKNKKKKKKASIIYTINEYIEMYIYIKT